MTADQSKDDPLEPHGSEGHEQRQDSAEIEPSRCRRRKPTVTAPTVRFRLPRDRASPAMPRMRSRKRLDRRAFATGIRITARHEPQDVSVEDPGPSIWNPYSMYPVLDVIENDYKQDLDDTLRSFGLWDRSTPT